MICLIEARVRAVLIAKKIEAYFLQSCYKNKQNDNERTYNEVFIIAEFVSNLSQSILLSCIQFYLFYSIYASAERELRLTLYSSYCIDRNCTGGAVGVLSIK